MMLKKNVYCKTRNLKKHIYEWLYIMSIKKNTIHCLYIYKSIIIVQLKIYLYLAKKKKKN